MQNSPNNEPSRRVELLLPVGTKDMALAAIHNGADAIFLGMPGFNARGRSHDFEFQELEEIISVCHLYGVKVNIAFNVVIFEEELTAVVEALSKVLPLKPDAFIVQDLGLVQIIKKMAPGQRVHASTQMTVTNHEAIQLLEDLDIKRFVVGRENSIEEIKKIRANTTKEIETFVHGALCVSYSGQCFTSEGIGGRSANRGQCAQSCRFSYELHVDGEKKEMNGKKYVVSPQDLCGIDDVSALVEAGVDCFKIEGRLKTPEYVATAAQAYREALELVDAKNGKSINTQQLRKNMAVSYSRGFFNGWLQGVNHQKLVGATFSAHRGYEIGTIVDAYKNVMTIAVKDQLVYESLCAGDGLLWSNGPTDMGGFIYSVDRLPKSRMRIEFARDITLPSNLEGRLVYQNHDKELKKELSQRLEDKNKKKRLPVDVLIRFVQGSSLWAKVSDGDFTVEGSTSSIVELAQSRGVSDESLEEEFSSLSGTIFKLNKLIVERANDQKLFLPHKEIKNLRQQLLSELHEKRQNAVAQNLEQFEKATDVEVWIQSQIANSELMAATPIKPKLNVLLREKQQVSDLVEAVNTGKINKDNLDTITLDFEFGRDYKSSCEELRSANLKVGLATTRILKPNEYRNLKVLADLGPDSILVRNLGSLQYFSTQYHGKFELRGDFSLNVTNHLSAQYLLGKGLNTLCVSYDLNYRQVGDLLKSTPAKKLETTIYQYMPSFHMEHCVFAAFLSEGSSYRDCGKPCEKHEVRLKDQFQNWHQIKPDQECRNTMFNAKAQSASRYLNDWIEAGVGYLRYEALKETGEELISKLVAHIDLINGQKNHSDLVNFLGAYESYGLSEGSLGREREYQSRKKFSEQGQ